MNIVKKITSMPLLVAAVLILAPGVGYAMGQPEPKPPLLNRVEDLMTEIADAGVAAVQDPSVSKFVSEFNEYLQGLLVWLDDPSQVGNLIKEVEEVLGAEPTYWHLRVAGRFLRSLIEKKRLELNAGNGDERACRQLEDALERVRSMLANLLEKMQVSEEHYKSIGIKMMPLIIESVQAINSSENVEGAEQDIAMLYKKYRPVIDSLLSHVEVLPEANRACFLEFMEIAKGASAGRDSTTVADRLVPVAEASLTQAMQGLRLDAAGSSSSRVVEDHGVQQVNQEALRLETAAAVRQAQTEKREVLAKVALDIQNFIQSKRACWAIQDDEDCEFYDDLITLLEGLEAQLARLQGKVAAGELERVISFLVDNSDHFMCCSTDPSIREKACEIAIGMLEKACGEDLANRLWKGLGDDLVTVIASANLSQLINAELHFLNLLEKRVTGKNRKNLEQRINTLPVLQLKMLLESAIATYSRHAAPRGREHDALEDLKKAVSNFDYASAWQIAVELGKILNEHKEVRSLRKQIEELGQRINQSMAGVNLPGGSGSSSD